MSVLTPLVKNGSMKDPVNNKKRNKQKGYLSSDEYKQSKMVSIKESMESKRHCSCVNVNWGNSMGKENLKDKLLPIRILLKYIEQWEITCSDLLMLWKQNSWIYS